MIRNNTPLGLVVLAATLVLFVGVFFLPPTVVAYEKYLSDEDDSGTMAVGPNGSGSGKNSQGDSGGGEDDDGEADPDWFQSGWNGIQMKKVINQERYTVPRTMVVPAIGPFGQLVNWMIEFVGNKQISYISFSR